MKTRKKSSDSFQGSIFVGKGEPDPQVTIAAFDENSEMSITVDGFYFGTRGRKKDWDEELWPPREYKVSITIEPA